MEIDRLRSSYMNIATWVPQGSILGPLLFIINMNDLPNASRLFKCIIYADDTTLIANLNDFYAKHDCITPRSVQQIDRVIFNSFNVHGKDVYLE